MEDTQILIQYYYRFYFSTLRSACACIFIFIVFCYWPRKTNKVAGWKFAFQCPRKPSLRVSARGQRSELLVGFVSMNLLHKVHHQSLCHLFILEFNAANQPRVSLAFLNTNQQRNRIIYVNYIHAKKLFVIQLAQRFRLCKHTSSGFTNIQDQQWFH